MSSQYAYNPALTEYKIICRRWDDQGEPDMDVLPVCESASWSENEGDAVGRLELTFANVYLENTGLFTEELFKNGERFDLYANDKLINSYWCWETSTSYSAGSNTHSVTLYDRLHNLSRCKESVYYAKDTKTSDILKDIFSRGETELEYHYKETKHEEIITKNTSMLNTISDVLNTAYINEGEYKPILVMDEGKAKIYERGWNEDIYVFYRYEPDGDFGNIIDFRRSASISSIVTRVQMKGTQKEDKTYESYGFLDGHTEFAIIQEELFAEGEKTKWDIKREALKILQEQGEQELSYDLEVPDIPHVRKGHKIRVELSKENRGYFYILSVSHNIGSKTMNLKIVPENYEHKTDTTLSDEELKEEKEYLEKKKAEEEAKKAAEAANNQSNVASGTVPSTGSKADQLIAYARQFNGYHEGPNNYSIFGERYGAKNSAWCAWFVRYCAEDVGLPFPATGYVPDVLSWGRKTGRISSKGAPGYYIIFNGGSHIEICIEDLGGGRVHSIGGNYSDRVDEHTRGGATHFINPFI